MTAPRYALMNALAVDRLPRAQLDELLAEVQARPPTPDHGLPDGIFTATNKDKARSLRLAQQAWLNENERRAPAAPIGATRAPAARAQTKRPAPTRTQGGPQSITRGAEALAIFAAIPACPVWGADPCTCALCTPQEATSR